MNFAFAVVALAVLFVAAMAFLYVRAVRKARRIRAVIREGLAAGKSLLYFSASGMRLNGEEAPESLRTAAGRERGALVEPGEYLSVGTYTVNDDDGRPVARFTDAELRFVLKPGREYELGVFLFDPEILSTAVAYRQLGPSGSGQGILALACVAC